MVVVWVASFGVVGGNGMLNVWLNNDRDLGQLALDCAMALARLYCARRKFVSTQLAKTYVGRAIALLNRADDIASEVYGEESLERASIANEHGEMLTEFNMLKVSAKCRVFVEPCGGTPLLS